MFAKAVFLLALASGLRVSQLAALTRHQSLTCFEVGDAAVSLAPSPTFLAKNERVGHRLGPVRVPAWLVEGVHHALCPVAALRRYLSLSPGDHERLWVFPGSLRICNAWDLSKVICGVIKEAVPGSSPRANQVRSCASSLVFLRSFDLSVVLESGQWASIRSFVTRYLAPHIGDVPCVAMGALPN